MQAFKAIAARCQSLNLIFQPKEIVADFEKAIHDAARNIFPHVRITGCRFHLCQSFWRRIHKLGLVSDYKNKSSKVGEWLRWIFGLSMLEPSDVIVTVLCLILCL